MNKYSKPLKILMNTGKVIIMGVLFLYLAFMFLGFIFLQEQKDIFATLGDGKFELGVFGDHLALEDHRFGDDQLRILVNTIEKYAIKDETIFIVGDYRGGEWDNYWDIKTGEQGFYNEKDVIPRYLIMNLETADLKTFNTWEEIPPEDQAVFEKAKPYELGKIRLNRL